MRLLVLSLLFLLAGRAHAQTEPLPLRAYEPDTIADLPPWPGPMPTQFVDKAAYEQTLQSRLAQIDVRAAGLAELGKPPRTRHRLAGWLTIGAGLTIGALSLVATDDPPNDRAFRTWMGIGIAGGLIVVTGIAIWLSAPRNPHRREIRDLQREGEALKKELRRLKWEPVQTQVNLSAHGVALTMKF
jgi:hypothetical protein